MFIAIHRILKAFDEGTLKEKGLVNALFDYEIRGGTGYWSVLVGSMSGI